MLGINNLLLSVAALGVVNERLIVVCANVKRDGVMGIRLYM